MYLIISCIPHKNYIKDIPVTQEIEIIKLPQELRITFAGDIMAHHVNFKMNDYSLMYEEISQMLQLDDLSFGNFEAPVASSLPYRTYPAFNVQGPYAQAAIDAGFDVFSLANNHSNDQGKKGLQETYQWFLEKRNEGIYSSGIKSQADSPLTYEVIEKKGWTILFVAVTEILNSFNNKEYIDYIPPTETARKNFIEQIKQLRIENSCDIFIVSVHTYEPEYKDYISTVRKKYFHSLLDADVDIIWAHHPHVMQDWEIIKNKNVLPDIEYIGNKLIMYSMGNFVSGQRFTPNIYNPEAYREYTGDSILLEVTLQKQKDVVYLKHVEPIHITNYVDTLGNIFVKYFSNEFIKSHGSSSMGTYYSKRLELMSKYKGSIICK